VFGVILAAAVAAAPPAPAPTPAAPTPVGRPIDPLVCHTEPIEGWRITHKVCLPASMIAERQAEARRMLGRMQGTPSPVVAMPMMGRAH